MQHHIVFLDSEGIGPMINLPSPDFPHTWQSYSYTKAEDLVERLKDATIVMTCSVSLRAEQLAQLPKLQMISLALTGFDIVDIDYCRKHNIMVTNVPGYAENTVAEHSMAMILTLIRQVSAYHDLLRKVHLRQAQPKNIYFNYRIRELKGKVLGIIGSGPIAQRLAQLAAAFGMEVYFQDFFGRLSGPQYLPLERIIEISDILSINCPLTEETRDLIGANQLKSMKNDALIINTGRGGIINEAALISAMEQNIIAGAALDVIVDEPIVADNPLFQLIDMPNFILNPHVAWSSQEAMQSLINRAIDHIEEFVAGKIPDAAI